jgi:hypothetical protein
LDQRHVVLLAQIVADLLLSQSFCFDRRKSACPWGTAWGLSMSFARRGLVARASVINYAVTKGISMKLLPDDRAYFDGQDILKSCIMH